VWSSNNNAQHKKRSTRIRLVQQHELTKLNLSTERQHFTPSNLLPEYATSTLSYLNSCPPQYELHHVLSNHLSQMLLRSTSTPSADPPTRLSHLFNRASMHLLCTCPNNLNIILLIFSTTEVTTIISKTTSFLIISQLVCPHIHLKILISATCHR